MVLAVSKISLDLSLKKLKKKISKKVFKHNGLSITIETNVHITDHLNVTLNLRTRTYYPYRNKLIVYNILISNLTIHHQ